MKKTISFDLWNTLVVSNPKFQAARLGLCIEYSPLGVNDITQTLKEVKEDIDFKVQTFGIQFKCNTALTILANSLEIHTEDIEDFCIEYNEIFIENPPLVLPHVIETLTKLKEDYRLVLSSNTVMLSGEQLRLALAKTGLMDMFSHLYFSDELGVSKPNPKFFFKIQKGAQVMSKDILHVGDNLECDVRGGFKYGFKTIQVKPGEFKPDIIDTIKSLLK